MIDLTLERHRDLLRRGQCSSTSVMPGTGRACCSISNTRSRTRASLARASAESYRSECFMLSSTPKGRLATCTTRPTSTTGRWPRANPACRRSSSGPSARGSTARSKRRPQGHAIAHVVPEHLKEVREGKLRLIAKTEVAVKDRLTKEITYWDHRAEQLKLQERAGKPNAKLNSAEARKRADNLQGRLQKRLEELKLEAQISPLPPVVLGGVLVVPMGLIAAMTGQTPLPTRPHRNPGQRGTGAAIVMADRAQPRL